MEESVSWGDNGRVCELGRERGGLNAREREKRNVLRAREKNGSV